LTKSREQVSRPHTSTYKEGSGTVFPVSAVVGAAVPAAVCRVPLGAVPVLSWCGELSLGGKQSSSSSVNLKLYTTRIGAS